MSSYENGGTSSGWVNRETGATADLDTVFGVLRDSRRRCLLYHLVDADDAVLPLEEVVEAVREYEAEGGELPSRQRVRTSLVHHHLPQLADVDVLEHDPRRGTVRFDGLGPLEGWLSQAREFERS